MKFTAFSRLPVPVALSSSARRGCLLMAAAVVFLLLPSVGGAQLAGNLKPDFAPTVRKEGTVVAMATQADGKQIVSGRFYRAGSTISKSVARLNADGSPDDTFMPPTDLSDSVLAAVGMSGKVAIVEFTGFRFNANYRLSLLNADGSLDTNFAPVTFEGGSGGDDVFPFVLAVQPDDKVLLGGEFKFDSNSSLETNTIVRYNADGTPDTGFTFSTKFRTESRFSSVLLLADGQMLLGGDFSLIDSNGNRHGIIRLNSDGSWDETYQPSVAEAHTLALQPDGKLLFLAEPDYYVYFPGGLPQRLNADGTTDTGFTPPTFAAQPKFNSLVLQPDGKIVIGGYTSTGSEDAFTVGKCGVLRLNADGTLDASYQAPLPLVDNLISALALQSNGQILVAGNFNTFGGSTHASLARLNTDGTVDATYTAGLTLSAAAFYALAQSNGQALALTTGSIINGTAKSFVSSFGPDGLLRASFALPIPPIFTSHSFFRFSVKPDALIAQQSDGKILVEGYYKKNEYFTPEIKRFNPDGSLDTSFDVTTTNVIANAIAQQPDGRLLLAGYDGVDNYPPYPLMRLNIDGTVDSSFSPPFEPRVGEVRFNSSFYALALQADGRILAGGAPDLVSGQYDAPVIRFNPDGSIDANFHAEVLTKGVGTGNGALVYALALQPDGKVIVGGAFTMTGGVARGNLLRLNSDGTLDMDFGEGGAGTDATVRSIAVQADGKIVIGGDFTTVNGVPRNGVARLAADGSVDPQFVIGTGTGGSGGVNSVALTTDGDVLIGGSFKQFDGQERDGVALLAGFSVPVVSFVVPGGNGGNSTQVAEGGAPLKLKIVRTGGDINAPLTVRYKPKGANVAGTDYKALSGTATIPAGATGVKVKLRLLDDGVKDGNKTLKIKLIPAADGSYGIGTPGQAKIRIVDLRSIP